PVALNNLIPSRMVIAAENEVYESFDQDETVTDLGAVGAPNLITGFAYGHAQNSDLLWVSAGDQLFVRTSATGALNRVTIYPGQTIRDMVMDTSNPNVLYVIDSNQVFVTTNGGASFQD